MRKREALENLKNNYKIIKCLAQFDIKWWSRITKMIFLNEISRMIFVKIIILKMMNAITVKIC